MKVNPSHFNPFHAKAGEIFFKHNLETGGGDEGGRCGELGGGGMGGRDNLEERASWNKYK